MAKIRSFITGPAGQRSGLLVAGMDELLATMQSIPARLGQRMAGTMYRHAEEIMTDAKRLTPVDTGALRGSGHVRSPVVTPRMVAVTLGFGGPAIRYALVQHERTDFHHTVGQAKFLEQPLRQRVPHLLQQLAVDIREELGAAG